MSNVAEAHAVTVLDAMGVSETQAVELLILDSRITDKQAELKDLRKEFVAKLPVATEGQLDAIIALARIEAKAPEGLRVNQDFRLTEAQEARLDTAKKEREEECEAKAKEFLAPVLSDPTQKLRSFKVRQGPKKTVTTARWEKAVSTSEESRSLIAQLARATQ